MKIIKVFWKRHELYSDIFSAFLQEPESPESQAELLEAAVQINEVNFVEDIIAPDSSVYVGEEHPGSVDSLYAAFSDLDIQEQREPLENRNVIEIQSSESEVTSL